MFEYSTVTHPSVSDYGTGRTANGFCAHRLPCGLCTITNKFCPMGTIQRTDITCNDNSATSTNTEFNTVTTRVNKEG